VRSSSERLVKRVFIFVIFHVCEVNLLQQEMLVFDIHLFEGETL